MAETVLGLASAVTASARISSASSSENWLERPSNLVSVAGGLITGGTCSTGGCATGVSVAVGVGVGFGFGTAFFTMLAVWIATGEILVGSFGSIARAAMVCLPTASLGSEQVQKPLAPEEVQVLVGEAKLVPESTATWIRRPDALEVPLTEVGGFFTLKIV